MGRHTDTDTLELIRRLEQKGKSKGFTIEEEYVLIKGEAYVDLVWKLQEEKNR